MAKRLTFEELMQEANLHGYQLVQKPEKKYTLRIAGRAAVKALTKWKMELPAYSTSKPTTNLKGCMRGIEGDPSGLRGDVSRAYGNVSALRGIITGLYGDVSGLDGDCTGVSGCATGVFGNVTDLRGPLSDHYRK